MRVFLAFALAPSAETHSLRHQCVPAIRIKVLVCVETASVTSNPPSLGWRMPFSLIGGQWNAPVPSGLEAGPIVAPDYVHIFAIDINRRKVVTE